MSNTEMKRHGGTGRKKIEIKKIENKSHLLTTFSKRRNGLFNKARDLCVLCGAEVAVLVFSPNGKPYAFGHPSMDAVIDCFLNGGSTPDEHACGGGHIHGENQQCMEPASLVRATKKEEAVEESSGARGGGDGFWWDRPIENMDLVEIETFKAAMEELGMKVAMRVDQMMMQRECNAYGVPPGFPYYGERI